jgi:hypothetical protein
LRLLLPFEGAGPIGAFILVELLFPLASRLLAGSAGVVLGVAPDAIAMTNVIKQLALKLAGDSFAVHGGSQIRSLQTGREGAG